MARTPSSSRRRVVIGAGACALATVALWAATAPAAVNYPDFTSTAGLKLNGSAVQNVERLRITDSVNDQTGSAFTKKAVVKPTKNFKTHFQIYQWNSSTSPGDGMAFVIQKKGSSALGAGGGGLGYGGIAHSLIVEFDIYQNDTDPGSGNHIALMKDGDAATHIDAEDPGFALYQNAPFIWVNYNAKAKRLKVWATTDSDIKPAVPELDHKVNLNQILVGSNGYAGFTGATGGSNARQDVFSWTLKSG
jgi:hypothetical protein